MSKLHYDLHLFICNLVCGKYTININYGDIMHHQYKFFIDDSVSNCRGLGRLDKEGHWQTYTNANTNGGLPGDNVRALAQSLDGALWVGTDGGSLVGPIRRATGRRIPRPTPTVACPVILSMRLRRAPTAPSGSQPLVAAGEPLNKDGHWQTYTKANTNGGLPDDSVQALAQSPDGALWVATLGGGLGRLDKEGHWQTYTKANTNGGLPGDSVHALAQSPDGALWVATRSRPEPAR